MERLTAALVLIFGVHQSSKNSSGSMSWEQGVGITLALLSGCFVGASVVFTKKALLDLKSRGHDVSAGSHEYLKSGVWWIGMILTALGEIANFGAYAFVPAILVTPLGAISVVISAVLSAIFLNEKLNFSGIIGCAQCLIGAVIIVLHAPASQTTETIDEFFGYVLKPVFLTYTAVVVGLLCWLIFYLQPRYAQKSPVIYISISSLGGSYLVLSTQGFGTALVYSIRNWHTDNQFLKWPIYPLLAFVVFFILFQVHFLNKALSSYSAAIVTPIYYVFFTTATMTSTAFLFQGFPVGNAVSGVSILFGFLTIVGGVALLFQYSLKLQQIAKNAGESIARVAGSIRDDAASISVRHGGLGRSTRPSHDVPYPEERGKSNVFAGRDAELDLDARALSGDLRSSAASKRKGGVNDSAATVVLDTHHLKEPGQHITFVESPAVADIPPNAFSPASKAKSGVSLDVGYQQTPRQSFVIDGDDVNEDDEVTSISHALVPGLKFIKMMPSLVGGGTATAISQRSGSMNEEQKRKASDARSFTSWMRRKSESIDVADTRTRSLPRSQPQAPPREHTLAEWEGSVSDPGNASVDIALRISSGTASSSAFSSKLGDDTSSYRKDSKGSQSVPIVPPKTDPDAIVAHHGEGTEVERISSDTVVPAGQRPYEPLPPSSPGWLSSNHTGFELDLVNAAVPLAGTGFVSPETTPPGLGRGKGVGSGASLVLPAKKGS